MEVTILRAMERNEKLNKVRDAGFVPGVLNRAGAASASVQFETKALNNVIKKYGSNAKVWIETGTEKKFGYLKEVQIHPVQRNILHVAVQLVTQDQEVKMLVPITFQGSDELGYRQLHINVMKPEIEVIGKAAMIPGSVEVEVSEKQAEDTVTASDIHLPAEIKILDPEHEVYAIIKAVRTAAVEEPGEEAEEAAPAE